ncbi:MAG: tRNA (adenosine(37)-N6)-dimethylallyltransferase MiaA, partial [Clostridia bacterium]|nr:tRNA (adenosine(37)-N6)-dimethylallyltransferase MiaA [Clostridia bacterium]
MNKPTVFFIVGPTASGKTDAAVQAAKRMNGEVISADAIQIYRGLDKGSAKPSAEEMQGIPHHLLDVCDPKEAFDLARYAAEASEAIREIHGRGHIPILCGGTGFY